MGPAGAADAQSSDGLPWLGARSGLYGHDVDSQDVGTRRCAFYDDLPLGRDEFHAIASNGDGAAAQSVAPTLPPPVFQTVWFQLPCAAAVAVCLLSLFVLRVRRMSHRAHRELERRINARVEERTRIARDLHDSLLQGFQGVMFRLQAVRQLLSARSSEAAVLLDAALESGDKAMAEGREAARDLREATLSQGELSETLAAFGKEFLDLLAVPQPTYQLIVEGKPRPLDPLVRDEVYRIAREAIRNAFRHAGATRIEVELVYGAACFRIRVRDDGIGIDGAGTEIELKIPSQIAFAAAERPWRLPGPRSSE
jgi:signal transduction histidine kinase